MITSHPDSRSSGRHSDEYSQQFEQLGSPSAESASKALRLALLASADVDQRAVEFIKRALLIDQDGVRDRLNSELKATSDTFLDRVGATLLHVNAEIFGKDVILLFAQAGNLGQPLVASALSAVVVQHKVTTAVLEVLHDREIQKLNGSCLTKNYEFLIELLAQVLELAQVKVSLLVLAAHPHQHLSTRAREVLSGAIDDPTVASHFVSALKSEQGVDRSLDLIGLLLEAPSLTGVIECLATQIHNLRYRERILERAGAHPHLHEVKKMLITVVSAATWGATWGVDVYMYSFDDSMRKKATEIIDQQLGLGGLDSELFAPAFLEWLSNPSSSILSFLRERLNNKSIQRTLIKGLENKEGVKALWCAKLLMQVCDQPEVRSQLLPAALHWPTGRRNLALEVLSGEHCSTLQEPREQIGDRRRREQIKLGAGDYRWEG